MLNYYSTSRTDTNKVTTYSLLNDLNFNSRGFHVPSNLTNKGTLQKDCRTTQRIVHYTQQPGKIQRNGGGCISTTRRCNDCKGEV